MAKREKIVNVPQVVTSKEVNTLLKNLGAILYQDTERHHHRMGIRSESSNREYIVSRRVGGDWECSCPGWCMRRTCKHLDSMRPGFDKVVKLLE